MVKKIEVSKQKANEFAKLTVVGNIGDIVRVKEPLDFSGVGVQEDGSLARFILVEGAPGIGKTTFAWEVSRRWSRGEILNQYRLVVLLRLRDKRVREAKNIYDLFYYSNKEVRSEVAKEIERINGESVLLLYEGYDELPATFQSEQSIFLEILNRECLPEATVLITSRPCATEFLQDEFKENIDQHIEILGFTKADVQSYIQSTVNTQSLQTEFSQYLKCYPHIRSLMYVPLNAVIVTETYKKAKLDGSQELVPTTLTEVYTSLSRGMLLRYLKGYKEYNGRKWRLNSFSDLPDELHKQFRTICEVAFQGILKGEVIFDDLPSDFNTLDLMQSAPELYIDQETVFSHNFFHLTLQEFLAAVHVSQQPTEKQLQYFVQSIEQIEPLTKALETLPEPDQLLDQERIEAILQTLHEPLQLSKLSNPTSESCTPQESLEAFMCKQLQLASQLLAKPQPTSPMQNVLRFTAGLTKFRNVPVDSLTSILLQDQGRRDERDIALNALHWLFEGQCSSDAIREMTTLTFDYSFRTMDPFDCFVLGFAISRFNCAWDINLWGTQISDEGLEMLVAGMSHRKAALPPLIQQVSLNLTECDISSIGLSHLKEMPKDVATRITKLNLNGNSGEGVTGLLRKLTNLTTLDLEHATWSPQEVGLLAEFLSHTENMKYLNLKSSLNSPDSTSHILRALCYNTTLQEVFLRKAHISEDSITLLTSALRTSTTLRKLHLERCDINVHSCCEISNALCNNSTLEILNLSCNPLGRSGATALSEMLRRNKTLQELIILDTSIGEDGTFELNQSLVHNSTLKQLRIHHDCVV